jgi:hypothetical protein
MKKQTRKHTAEFEAIQGLKGQNGIANDFETHPIMVGKWKNGLIQRKIGQLTTSVFPRRAHTARRSDNAKSLNRGYKKS